MDLENIAKKHGRIPGKVSELGPESSSKRTLGKQCSYDNFGLTICFVKDNKVMVPVVDICSVLFSVDSETSSGLFCALPLSESSDPIRACLFLCP